MQLVFAGKPQSKSSEINRVLAFSDEGEWDISEVGDFEEVFWEQVDAYLTDVIEESEEDPCDNYYMVIHNIHPN
jgi:hypothetical protein